MIHLRAPITDLTRINADIFVLTLRSPELAQSCRPGQFINIRVHDLTSPLLRRPFSVYWTGGDQIKIIFNVVGTGTRILAEKRPGESLDIIGPLGVPFGLEGEYESALLVAGGLGVAPMPMVTAALKGKKKLATFLGARSSALIVGTYLENLECASDDGSAGFHGTVVDLLRVRLSETDFTKPKVFACGPSAMLRSLSELTARLAIPCEVSLETSMACGIGLCQGCPVEREVEGEKKYSLVCKEGPVFDARMIRIR